MTSLPTDGPQREIFLVALRAFSDACEAPALHPDCPFSIEVGPGVRGCGEECMDLLGEFQVPVRQVHLDIGDGLALRELRSRPRRGPDPTAKPFDSLELHLADTSRDADNPGSWSTVSLLVELRGRLTVPPPEEVGDANQRRHRIEQVSRELDRRQIDPERAVSEGLRTDIANAIFFTTALGGVFSQVDIENSGKISSLPRAPAGWQGLIFHDAPRLVGADSGEPDGLRIIGARVGPAALERWVETASLEAVIDWAPPAELSDERPTDSSEYRWLVERLTTTYLSEWSEYSLQQEWRFIQGSCPLPCPAKEMKARLVGREQVAAELADRTIRKPTTGLASAPAASAAAYQPIALKMLEQGRRSEAAAIFEATIAMYPEDATAHNNHAFCILPDDAARALESLDRATDFGRRREPVTTGNRLMALLLLDRLATAIKFGDHVFSTWSDMASLPGSMWEPEATLGGDPVIVRVPDVRNYVLDVLSIVAQRSGDPALRSRWLTQIDNLRSQVER